MQVYWLYYYIIAGKISNYWITENIYEVFANNKIK